MSVGGVSIIQVSWAYPRLPKGKNVAFAII